MINRIIGFIHTLMGSACGIFLGTSIYKCIHYYTRPGLYASYSAPWYTSIQVNGVALLIFAEFSIKSVVSG